MTVEYRIGDVFDRLAEIPDGSVHSVITSPPYWRKRRYISDPAHPDYGNEIGQENSPGEFIATMLRLTDELHRIVRDDGTVWINLDDSASGSGGAGGDYNEGGQKAGQNRYDGTGRAVRDLSLGTPYGGKDMPMRKSVCWIPQLLGASMAYGRNLLTGEPCTQWVTRPPVTWCKPSVTPGRCDDRFRHATELIVWASKRPTYYWDKAAILEPLADSPGNRYVRKTTEADRAMRDQGSATANTFTADEYDPTESAGVPPFDWWVVSTSNYDGAHYATYPEELVKRPLLASCPPGGTVLDPFGGSGTTGRVALSHGRKAILIDFDERNADLARDRVGMFLDVVPARPSREGANQ